MNTISDIKIPEGIEVTEHKCACGGFLWSVKGQLQKTCPDCQIAFDERQRIEELNAECRRWELTHPSPSAFAKTVNVKYN